MTCTQCGSEIPKGGYFCGSCGRPVGYGDMKPGVLVDEVGLEDVPEPMSSMQRPRPSSEGPKRSLCSICLGAFPVAELSSVDGQAYCAECSPVRARRAPGPGAAAPVSPLAEVGEPEFSGHVSPDRLRSRPPPVRTVTGDGSSRGRLLLLALLAAALGVGGYLVVGHLTRDRIDLYVAGADADREDARLLVRKYEAGETLSYNVKQKGRMQAEGRSALGSGEVGMTFDIGFVMDMQTLAVDEEGNGEIRFLMRNMKTDFELEIDGVRQFDSSGLGDAFPDEMSFRLRMDPFQQPLGNPVYEDDSMMLGMQGQLGELLTQAVEGVPKHRLKVGDVWETKKTLPLGGEAVQTMLGGGSLSLCVKHEVVGYKVFESRDCMVISFEGDLESAGIGGGSPLGAKMDIEGVVKGVILFDYETGHIVKEATDAEVQMSGDMMGATIEAKIEMQADVDLVSR